MGQPMVQIKDTSMTKPEECQSCGFETAELRAYTYGPGSAEQRGVTHYWACDLCASTVTSTRLNYPSDYKDKDVLGTICYVGNRILEAIYSRREVILLTDLPKERNERKEP